MFFADLLKNIHEICGLAPTGWTSATADQNFHGVQQGEFQK
jgi:hypothetical protein